MEGKMSIPNTNCDGLVFRLNSLWSQIDDTAKKVDYNEWNILLDQIYRNLSYKGTTKFLKDKKGKILKINKPDDEYVFLSKRVNVCRQLNLKAKKVEDKKITWSDLYRTLNDKDIWLRRYMHKFNLYLKETKRRR